MMKFILKYGLFVLLLWRVFGLYGQDQNSIVKLLNTQTTFEVGEKIVLEFEGIKSSTLLYCSNSYGSLMLRSTSFEGKLTFEIPKFMTQKAGILNWQLTGTYSNMKGSLKLISQNEAITIETYLGPNSINVGINDYAMLIAIPTDVYDNLLPDGNTVIVSQQFKTNIDSLQVQTEHYLAYKKIYAAKEEGRMLISGRYGNTVSKEMTLDVLPHIPVDFQIFAERPHQYADANQMTRFSTSVIQDKEGNTVSDGTLVKFLITQNDDGLLQTSGTTINGVASAAMIHPDRESFWTVKAIVDGMAESNLLNLEYRQAVKDFEVEVSDQGRTIIAGPFQSFMQQFIPDGLSVNLEIYRDETLIYSAEGSAKDGYVEFRIRPEIVQEGMYTLKLQSAGIKKTLKTVKIW